MAAARRVVEKAMKTCKTCSQAKDLSEFSSHKGYPDGYERHCKECLHQKRRKHTFTCTQCGRTSTGYIGQEFCNLSCSSKRGRGGMHYACMDCGVEVSRDAKRCAQCRAKLKLTPEQILEHKKQWQRDNRDRLTAYDLERRRNHLRPKYLARKKVQDAVRRGLIVKPSKCSCCGIDVQPERLQGHHEDYGRVYDVQWLCNACHKKYDSRANFA